MNTLKVYVAGERSNAYEDLVGKPAEKRPVGTSIHI
jgi:hypothetical protein